MCPPCISRIEIGNLNLDPILIFYILELSSLQCEGQIEFDLDEQLQWLRRPPTSRPNDSACWTDPLYRDPRDSHQSPNYKENFINLQVTSVILIQNLEDIHLNILRIIIPSTCGSSTNFPSTSNLISLCKSLQGLRPTIFRNPILT